MTSPALVDAYLRRGKGRGRVLLTGSLVRIWSSTVKINPHSRNEEMENEIKYRTTTCFLTQLTRNNIDLYIMTLNTLILLLQFWSTYTHTKQKPLRQLLQLYSLIQQLHWQLLPSCDVFGIWSIKHAGGRIFVIFQSSLQNFEKINHFKH